MNCSGKHTGMLRTCVAAGWSTDDYPLPDHPLQKQIRTAVEDLAGEPVTAIGVDGCGAPVMAISLRGLAGAFLRCATAAPGSDERRVADAMRAHPTLVSGTGADDEHLMTGVPGLLSKGGAEGVLAVAVPGARARSRSRSTTVRCGPECRCSSARSRCSESRLRRSTRLPRRRCSAAGGGSVRCVRSLGSGEILARSVEILVRFGCRRAGNAP